MTLQPGSFGWLLAHDMRLAWRGAASMFGDAGWPVIAGVLAAGAVVLHVLAVPVIGWLAPLLQDERASSAPLATVLVCTFTWMLAQSLFGAARTLYVRGDLDLLLGSPLSPRKVFAAKATAIAAGSFGSIALLVLPIANAGAIVSGPAWLGIYPTLAALALLATGLGLALTIAIFGLVGASRARLWTQMTGAVIAGSFVLGAQIIAMLPAKAHATIVGALEGLFASGTAGPMLLVRLPLEAFRGNAGAGLVLIALAGVVFASAAVMLGRRFADISVTAASAAAAGTGSKSRGGKASFRAGLAANMHRKEWRLLARDPSMFAQLALQIIYTIPVAVVLLRNESLPPVFALAPTIVVVAAQLAASLAWLTVSGEDAPELIATAPVTAAAVNRAKLNAVALPVAAILAIPLLGLATLSWSAALLTAAVAAAAGTSTALLNFWHPMPGNRRGMLRRHSQSKLVALIEHGLALLWAVVIVLAMLQNTLAAVPVALVIAILAVFRHKARA